MAPKSNPVYPFSGSPNSQPPVSAQSSTSSLIPPNEKGGHFGSPGSSPIRSNNPFSASSGGRAVIAPSISDKFSLSADPSQWGSDLTPGNPEPDDYLHNPDPKRDRKNDQGGTIFTSRGIMNLGCLLFLGVGLIALFAGYPLVGYFMTPKPSNLGSYNTGGTNATGQVPLMTGNFALIDADTPVAARTKKPYHAAGGDWDLVFSDEFNVEGRTFYPGDDPFWEAVDLHYWGTNNLEWYDPSMVTTQGGSLKITLDRKPAHDLAYMGGLISSWNKFCFTGGIIEASVSLPGRSDVFGLWPALWTMGNLGRAGYGASLDGMWPYSYDSCDYGTLQNQTLNGIPRNALTMGDKNSGGTLSYLPGQRLSRCTCHGAKGHPGPIHPDGDFVGRSAPEIDVFEAQVTEDTRIGMVSQSCQWAPFDANYEWPTEGNLIINDPTVTTLNSYKGGVFQQASSAVSVTDQNCYSQMPNSCFSVYGFEYKPGGAKEGGYVTWINNAKPAWTILSTGMGPNELVQIGERPIPQEPLYMIVNLGISRNFGPVDEVNLVFPTVLLIDWIRVYQPRDAYNVGCSPPNFPTEDYINTYIEAYTNPNLTTWAQYGQTNPDNYFALGGKDKCPPQN